MLHRKFNFMGQMRIEGSWCSDEAKLKKVTVYIFKWLSFEPRKRIGIERGVQVAGGRGQQWFGKAIL